MQNSNSNEDRIRNAQEALCLDRKLPFLPAVPDSILGYAVATNGQFPLNGLRHRPVADTNGWFIWRGEVLSEDSDFFSPLHTIHLQQSIPEVLPFLGLPPGSRFLIHGDYVDVWFDESLL